MSIFSVRLRSSYARYCDRLSECLSVCPSVCQKPMTIMTGSSFETEQHIRNLKHVSGAYMIALNIDLEIWPTPPLIFTQGVKKC